VQFIFQQAGVRPCVINASLGTNGGPHDGTTLVEIGIDRLLTQASNRGMVIAASNSFSDGIHAAGSVAADGSMDLVWNIPSSDATGNELEIWYSGPDRFRVEVIAPNGTTQVSVDPGQTRALKSGGQVVLLAANRLTDPNNHDNMIGIFLEAGLPLGAWTIRLHGVQIQNGNFHAWIERDDAGQSSFPEPRDNSHTIGSISCGKETIVVGSYDAHKTSLPLSFFSSAGPTRDGRKKPEVAAPGHNVLAAHSRTKTGTTRKSGTSMASPAVTGTVALLLSEANARGQLLTSAQIRDKIITSARRDPPAGNQWDPNFGFGRVSARKAVGGVMPSPPVAST
jgi:subtilisin family serine protease